MMIGFDNPLCIRCKWREIAPYENCKDCPDHETGVCLMAEAYQKGREDAMAELWKKAISRYDCMLSLEELDELIEQIKEQKNNV